MVDVFFYVKFLVEIDSPPSEMPTFNRYLLVTP